MNNNNESVTANHTPEQKLTDLSPRVNRYGRLNFLKVLNITYIIAFLIVFCVAFLIFMGIKMDEDSINTSDLLIKIAVISVLISFGRFRLHDLNRSGWWMLLIFVPLVNIGFLLYLLCAPGTEGENRYGLPKERSSVAHIPVYIVLSLLYICLFFVGSAKV